MGIYSGLVYVLNEMNKNVSFTTKNIADIGEVSERTALDKINLVKKYILNNIITYEKPYWKARKGFLDHLNISSERIVAMSGLLSLKSHFGEELAETIDEMMNDLQRSGLLLHDHQQVLEKLSQSASVQLNRLISAINNGCMVEFKFSGTIRKVHPYKVINREYYWYLVGYEEEKIDLITVDSLPGSKKIKTYTIAKIKAVNILEEEINYDFKGVDEILKLACNGYIDWDNPPHIINVMVNNRLDDYISRAMFYNNWKKISSSATKGFTLYRVASVHKEYQDVIPTILKHMPDMIVLEPIELVNTIKDITFQHSSAVQFHLESNASTQSSQSD